MNDYQALFNVARLEENRRTKMLTPPQHWIERAFRSALEAASWSKDPRRKVGAVVMNQDKRMFQGFNGFPKHVQDHETLFEDREAKRALMIHGEINAMNCAGDVRDCILFVTAPTCERCAAQIVDRGIIAVHCLRVQNDEWDHYRDAFRLAQQTYALAGVQYREYNIERHDG